MASHDDASCCGSHGSTDPDNIGSTDGETQGRLGSEAAPIYDDRMRDALEKWSTHLCHICRRVLRGRHGGDTDWYDPEKLGSGTGARLHHESPTSLFKSVNAGCPMCDDIERALAKMFGWRSQVQEPPGGLEAMSDPLPEVQEPSKDSQSIYSVLKDNHSVHSPHESFNLWFYLHSPHDEGVKPRLILLKSFFLAARFQPGPEYLDPSPTFSTAQSTTSIELARSWYEQCLGHSGCRSRDFDGRVLPTRLIQIRKISGEPSKFALRLCHTGNRSARHFSYTTLSHRWGDSQLPTLQTTNLHTLQQDICFEELPQLFRDAIYMTAGLGINYIWIDCLCIIQDSKEVDWVYEARRMGDYYRHAELNLAASGYKSGQAEGGLFRRRLPLPFAYYPIRVDCEIFFEKQGHRIPLEGYYIPADTQEFTNAVDLGHLNSRGWVAQERALSPAILHFTPAKMWWECNRYIVNEVHPTTPPKWEMQKIEDGPSALRPIISSSDVDEIYAAWGQFVGRYAGTALSVEADRFPAIAGIARILSKLVNDNLIAGMWEKDLIPSLTWKASHLSAKPTAQMIPSTLIAPSWSWASWGGCHIPGSPYNDTLHGISFRVLSDVPGFKSDLQCSSMDKSGVRGLHMTAPLRKLPSSFVKLEAWGEYMSGLSYCQRRVIESPLEHGKFSVWGRYVRFIELRRDVYVKEEVAAQEMNHDQDWRWSDPTHLLPLSRRLERIPKTVTGLLLHGVPGAPNTFRRLGQVEFAFLSDELVEEFFGLLGGDSPTVGFEERGLQDFILV